MIFLSAQRYRFQGSCVWCILMSPTVFTETGFLKLFNLFREWAPINCVIHYIWNSKIESRQAGKAAGQYYLDSSGPVLQHYHSSSRNCLHFSRIYHIPEHCLISNIPIYIPVTRPGHISLPSVWSPRGPAEVLAPGGGPGSRGDVSSIYTGTTDHTPGQTFRAFISSHIVPKVQLWYYSLVHQDWQGCFNTEKIRKLLL